MADITSPRRSRQPGGACQQAQGWPPGHPRGAAGTDTSQVAIDLAPVTKVNDHHDKLVIVDRVDHPVFADSNPVGAAQSLQGDGAVRTGVCLQLIDGGPIAAQLVEADVCVSGELARSELDRIEPKFLRPRERRAASGLALPL